MGLEPLEEEMKRTSSSRFPYMAFDKEVNNEEDEANIVSWASVWLAASKRQDIINDFYHNGFFEDNIPSEMKEILEKNNGKGDKNYVICLAFMKILRAYHKDIINLNKD